MLTFFNNLIYNQLLNINYLNSSFNSFTIQQQLTWEEFSFSQTQLG